MLQDSSSKLLSMPPLGATIGHITGQAFAADDRTPTHCDPELDSQLSPTRSRSPTASVRARVHDINLPLRDSTSSTTTMAPSRSASTGSNDLVELVRRLLRMPRSGAATQNEAHPLAIVLLLLECRLVQALAPCSQRTEATTYHKHAVPVQDDTRDDSPNDEAANIVPSSQDTSQGPPPTAETRTMPLPRSSAPTAAVGAHSRTHARAIQRADGHDTVTDRASRPCWAQRTSYMNEVYMHRVEKDGAWASPLYVPRHVAPSLVSAMSETDYNVRAQRLWQSSIDELEAYIITHFGFTCPSNALTATTPLTTDWVSDISALVAARRRSPLSLANPTSDVFCRLLASSLAQLVSPECFGVSGGGARYAILEQDDQAIRRYFSGSTHVGTARPKPVSWATSYSRPADQTSREVSQERVSLAHYLPSGSSTTITPPRSTATGKKPRPMSVGSYGAESYTRSPSMMTFDSAQSSPFGHVRHNSRPSDTESVLSNTPLLAACSSPVAAAPFSSQPKRSFSPKPRPPPVFIEDTARDTLPSPVAPPFSSLISKASASHEAETDPSSPSAAVASRTNCTLSPDERRHFIRQAKKLEHLLGKPVKEAQAKEIVQARTRNGASSLEGGYSDGRSSIQRKRSYSHPLVPTNVHQAAKNGGPSTQLWSLQVGGQDMRRANTSPNPSSPTSPPASNQFLGVASPTSPGGALSPLSPTTPTGATDATTMAFKNREQRRKKLAKLHHLLGEKVPVELALCKPGSVSSLDSIEAPGSRRNGTGAKKIWERAKGHVHAPWHNYARQHDEAGLEQARRDEFIVDVEPDRHVLAVLTPEASAGVGPTTSNSTSTRAAELKNLATARKLEDRFGALPPKNLFQTANIKPPPRMDHRSSSDSKSSEISLPTSISSVESYRTSIASLRFLMEQDPEALDQIAVALHEDDEGEDGVIGIEADPPAVPQEARPLLHQHVEALSLDSDRFFSSEESAIDDETHSTIRAPETASPPASPTDSIAYPQGPPAHRTPSATMGSVRKVNKLLNFFGTLRGEVWNRLLDEMQLAIEGDEEIEKEDKTTLLLEVQKLRTFKPVDGRGGVVAFTAAG
ncbi:BZ3500_MvSof-1268-A1-R1_Chr5-3g08242 [Microbotryum saponariae]|uniref:BZ3500_MvSof-1268-A1-R1_Chr5-3g08242 protein n=1 Tax=Microbotryum saponariae TaxID=289078 RepID=A0A2X0L877_9BASI|nr:BZ3500_MvSof-1268-A1-R1_Chr5-3g08242 [Microbotryum saponariae]SDA08350.1 BZ3501_MvSof-1269-A2-R1_Chr5-3g07970 [Microbotryum saponariae]